VAVFPPATTTTLTSILAAYVYKQYEDDPNIQAFNAAYNGLAQQYMTYLAGLNLPVYTLLSGSLLDAVADNLYGVYRPALQSGAVTGVGPLNTWALNTITLNTFNVMGSVAVVGVNDDYYKRIITWNFYKGDGQYFSIPFLKKRVMRFLTCANGATTLIDNTYPVSVTFSGTVVTITITLTMANGLNLPSALIFQGAVNAGVLPLPFQYTYTITIVNDLGNTGLTNVSGVLNVTLTAGWPTSSSGLAAGKVWNNGGVVTVVPGVTPNPAAPGLIFGVVTSAQMLSVGGGNLPLSDPHNEFQLWNNSNVVNVSNG
jgi:hypothetical protein